MKNFHLFLLPFSLFTIVSCSSEIETTDKESHFSANVLHSYSTYRQKAKQTSRNTLESIDNCLPTLPSRNSTENLAERLSTIPIETIDSLYSIYCSKEKEEEYDLFKSNLTISLIEKSSIEEVQSLFEFTDLYIQRGGHDVEFIESSMRQVQNSTIQNCMVSCAANIDEYIIVSAARPGTESYCLHMLSLQIAKAAVENGIVDVLSDVAADLVVIPYADVAGALILAGLDLYSSLELALEYHKCRINHVS